MIRRSEKTVRSYNVLLFFPLGTKPLPHIWQTLMDLISVIVHASSVTDYNDLALPDYSQWRSGGTYVPGRRDEGADER